MNDSDFNTAWREFAKHDEETTAPSRLRAAVMASWDVAQQAQRDRDLARSRRMSVAALLGAAAAVVIIASVVMQKDRGRGPGRPPDDMAAVTETTVIAAPSRVDAFRLIADPTFEAESFEVVRVRVPRTSLEAIGVGLIGPEVASLVDVDVVVGGDGLPRAIRGIRPVLGIQ
jgi:hypothetical protein